MNVAFVPTANGAGNGSLSVSGASFPTQLMPLTGTGTGATASPLTFSPTSLSISGGVIGETSPAKNVTVTNASSATVNITNFVASADFHVIGTGAVPCGGALAPGTSCTAAVTFSPSMAGTTKGSITFMDNAPVNTQVFNVTGKAVTPVTFSAASLVFAAQPVGTTSPAQTVTLKNNQSVTLTLAGLTASGQYAAGSGGSNPCGSTVAAHSTCTFVVAFSPKQTGTVPGVVTINHNAQGNPQVVKLSGIGQ